MTGAPETLTSKLQNLGRILVAVATAAVAILVIICVTGCSSDNSGAGGDTGPATISLSVRTGTRSINEDTTLWEDRVDELRMLVFDAGDGSLALNQKLYFPDGFDNPSRAIRIDPGTYDFYFIANETAHTTSFTEALEEITNISGFTSDPRFTNLAYRQWFIPDGTTPQGRFLMSAIYTGITVASGGTEQNPLPLPLPTARVELIRALAKVEVVFRKNVSGSTIPDNAISAVRLIDVAQNYSVPPLDAFYTGTTTSTPTLDDTGFNYASDSIGAVTFYIPEFIVADGQTPVTSLEINNTDFPIQNDTAFGALTRQRRTIAGLSPGSVIRNTHYLINAYINSEGGIQIRVFVEPWIKDTYLFLFQGDQQIVVPPIEPGDSSVIIPTECGRIEILSHNEQLQQGLMGALNYEIVYYDPETQGPLIRGGDPPYYCEKKYGPGWRLINSCELLSFLAYTDNAYNIWTSNTWLADGYDMPYYPRVFREEAQILLQGLTGFDLSSTVLYDTNNNLDDLADEKLDIIDRYFTPGDILVRVDDFPGGWPYDSPPGTAPGDSWIYNQVSIQVKAYWYGAEYISPSIRSNWDRILYNEFDRFDFSSVSRCVREISD